MQREMIAFTPLSERLKSSNSELVESLLALKGAMGEKYFKEYIEDLISLKMDSGTVWLITKREMTRSLLERNHLPQIREAFGVANVRILVQPW